MYLLQRAFYHRGHRDRTENTEKRKDNFYCKELLTAEYAEVAKKSMYLLQRAFYHRGHRDRTENTEKRKDNFYCKEILTAEGTEVAKKKKICPPINTNKRFNYCKELLTAESTEKIYEII